MASDTADTSAVSLLYQLYQRDTASKICTSIQLVQQYIKAAKCDKKGVIRPCTRDFWLFFAQHPLGRANHATHEEKPAKINLTRLVSEMMCLVHDYFSDFRPEF